MDYVYLGDRNTADHLKKKSCNAVRKNGKCIRGRNGSMLVCFEDGRHAVIVGRLLRKHRWTAFGCPICTLVSIVILPQTSSFLRQNSILLHLHFPSLTVHPPFLTLHTESWRTTPALHVCNRYFRRKKLFFFFGTYAKCTQPTNETDPVLPGYDYKHFSSLGIHAPVTFSYRVTSGTYIKRMVYI